VKRRVADELSRGLARLAAAEQEIPLLVDRPTREAHFRRLGAWLVEERLLASLLRSRAQNRPVAAPPRLVDVGAAFLLPALALPPRWRARCRAQALFIKTHLRAFYGEPEPFTLKLVAPEARDAVARDAQARQGTVGLGTPRLLAHRSDGPYPYLCEELVAGHHPDPVQDADAVMAFVLGGLWDRYRTNGFSWQTCAESHDLGALISNFSKMTEAFAWPDKELLRGQLSSLDDEASKLVPWCLGHGDLSVGNMLMRDDRIVLLDWERTRRLPLLVELAKIVVTCPGAWAAVAARVRDELTNTPSPGMASPEALGALASLERLAALRTRFSAASPGAVASGTEARRFERRLSAELDHLAKLMATYST
jgi:hypothetical protein